MITLSEQAIQELKRSDLNGKKNTFRIFIRGVG